jgi:(R,R)-butanediol dehydrogenase/meso-butanediol dehydrogenase/diacetyl reductase
MRAAAILDPLLVAIHGIRRAALQPGESCIILGAGPVGLMTAAYARIAEARGVVVSEPSPVRRQIALEMGADAAVDPRLQNPLGVLAKITGAAADVVMDCAGQAGSLAETFSYARPGGRVVVLGANLQDDVISPAAAMNRELDVRFSLGFSTEDVALAARLLGDGRISPEVMITHTVDIEEFPRAFAALPHAINQVKVMLEFA